MNKFDYKKIKEKYEDSLSQHDLSKIFNNPDHGTLNFVEIQEEFERMFTFIYELELLDYKNNLYQQDINRADGIRNNLITMFNQIQQFDIKQPDATNLRQDLINRIRGLISSDEGALDDILVKLQSKKFLRTSGTGEQIQKIQTVISEIEVQKDTLSKQIKEQEDILIQQKEEFAKKIKELESSGLATSKESQGLAIGELDKFFSTQAKEHKHKSEGDEKNNSINWFKRLISRNEWRYERSVAVFYLVASVLIVAILFSWSVSELITGKLSADIFEHIWGLRSSLVIIAFFSVLYTNLYFKTAQFSKEKEMQFYNENKANIAKTLKDYTRGLSETDKTTILSKAAETLFNDVPCEGGKSDNKNSFSVPINLPLNK